MSSESNVEYISKELCLDSNGIWCLPGRNEVNISYPRGASIRCFIIEDSSFWFEHRNHVITRVIKRFPPSGPILDVGEISFATKSDLEEILRLTHKCFTNNPSFLSRFTNTRYFSQEETNRYYTAWIENNIENQSSLFFVLKKDQKIIGYSIIKEAGEKEGKKIYRAIFTALHPDYRGHNLYFLIQSFYCNYLPENRFYLDSTTQLTNLAMIQNQIKTQKTLDHIDLIFYWAQH